MGTRRVASVASLMAKRRETAALASPPRGSVDASSGVSAPVNPLHAAAPETAPVPIVAGVAIAPVLESGPERIPEGAARVSEMEVLRAPLVEPIASDAAPLGAQTVERPNPAQPAAPEPAIGELNATPAPAKAPERAAKLDAPPVDRNLQLVRAPGVPGWARVALVLVVVAAVLFGLAFTLRKHAE